MWELRKELETRKENLIYTLKNKKDFLELEKQHQIYGAIKELNHIIGLLEQYRENEMVNNPKQLEINASYVKASGGDEEEEEIKVQKEKNNTIKLVSEKVRKFKYPVRIKFAKNDA